MIHVELGPELEASLASNAEERQVSVEELLRRVIRESALNLVQKSATVSIEETEELGTGQIGILDTSTEKQECLRAWLAQIPEAARNWPRLSSTVYQRESYYEEQ